MASFKDKSGKLWNIALDAPTIREVRKECKDAEGNELDLADTEGRAFAQLVDDPILLVDVLWVLCRGQAGSMTDIEFGRAMVGDTIDYATKAMLEAIVDFFPQRKRQLLQAMSAKNEIIREQGLARALAKINDPTLEKRAIEAMEKKMDADVEAALMRLESATSSPAS